MGRSSIEQAAAGARTALHGRVAFLKPEARPVSAIGAHWRGATALGALALGAGAIGALAIGRLAVKSAAIERLRIEELEVGRLRVDELEIRSQTDGTQRRRASDEPPLGPPD